MTVVNPNREAAQGERAQAIEAALRNDWRMIEKVNVHPCREGDGVRIQVFLNPVLVRGSAEQRGLTGSYLEANPRVRDVVGECVERLNAELPAEDQIRSFQVID